jgi:D-glycero-beta-D-manno-heptose 1-phosphate adenylyltransferase
LILTLDEVQTRRQGKKLVFTNGVFDILHAGHVHYLEEAKKLGDMLIVGLNSDTSAKLLNKSPNRPINNEEDRAAVLAALRSVDGVLLFHEQTPETLIAELKPDVHVKGGDYKEQDLPEAKIVRAYGGEVVILPFLEGRSTTSILKRAGLE